MLQRATHSNVASYFKIPGWYVELGQNKKEFKMLSGRMHLLSNAEPACVSPLPSV